MPVFPLLFESIFKPKIWGGRRLQTVLGKHLPPGVAIGESWELADLESDQSIVRVGPAQGRSLAELLREWGADLLGRTPPVEDRFPLLIKFLDAADTLSVQVHPDEAMARRRGGSVRVKHEAWYVLDATPAGFIYRGVRDGVTRDDLLRAIHEKRVESSLRRLSAKAGHCFYLPSGTVHALGAGVLVAEVQTPSDTTYRLYDFDRVEATTGRLRDLHLDEAMECMHVDPVPAECETPQHVASLWTSVTSLVRCPSFVIERVRMVEGVEQRLPYEEMIIWIVLEGHGEVGCKGLADPVRFERGDTVLLPAALKDAHVRTLSPCLWLEVSVPVESTLKGFTRPSRASLASPVPDGGFVPLNIRPSSSIPPSEAPPARA